MFLKRLILAGLALALVLPLALAEAQEAAALKFAVSEEPAIERGPDDEWDGRFTDPGAATYHDGQYHLFRNGFARWPAPVQIAYHTSDDGESWTEVQEEPVIYTDDFAGEVVAVLASSVLVEEDGTWVLYFYTYNDISLGEGNYIVRATASDPLGPWEFAEEPMLLPGEEDAWDSFKLGSPSVVRVDGQYLMFFEGVAEGDVRQIGRATSEDGVTWEKDAEPVFAPTGEVADFDGLQVHQPRVVVEEDGDLLMLYRAYRGRQNNISFGLARSSDMGQSWQRLGEEPVFSQADTTRRRAIWFSELVLHDGDLLGLFEVSGAGETNIHVGWLEGDVTE
jgi:predicted GH43/DUF377 family glycosyl hydrolase